jgi:protein-disulfide isomerase
MPAMKMLRLLFALACATTIASTGWAQTLAANQPLAFGSFAPGVSSGTVTISPAGARSSGGGVFLVSSGAGAAASYTVGGTSSATYAITLPSNGEVVLTSGPNSMAVNNFSSSPAGTGVIGGGGTQTLSVGATLTVGGNQATGSYSGSFNVTVEYN